MSHNEISRDEPFRELRMFDMNRRRATDAAFADLPLQDPAQHFMMMCILRSMCSGEAPSQRDLAKKMQRSPATVTASLKVLERQGLVRRYPDKSDQRINRVELTEAGKALGRECYTRMAALEQRMLRGLTEKELSQLSVIFRKMSQNLSALSNGEKEELTFD